MAFAIVKHPVSCSNVTTKSTTNVVLPTPTCSPPSLDLAIALLVVALTQLGLREFPILQQQVQVVEFRPLLLHVPAYTVVLAFAAPLLLAWCRQEGS